MTEAAATGSAQDNASLDLFCPACEYNLRGVEGNRCPECGLTVDRTATALSRLPWAHRERLGWARAYLRTNWLVLRHPKRLAEEINRPVSFRAAQLFRLVTVLLAYVPLLLVGLAWYVAGLRAPAGPGHPKWGDLSWVLEWITVASAAVSLWLLLLTATGAGSYFFHPRTLSVERQNRAVALSYYACAPLAWVVVPVVLGVASALLTSSLRSGAMELLTAITVLLAGTAAAALVMVWFVRNVLLLRRITGCTSRRHLLFAIYLPCAWVVLFGLIGVAIPAAVAFVSIVILSFR